MCYGVGVERIGIRELRNNTARAVRRAMGGERIVITIGGVPAAQLGPLNDGAGAVSVDDLIAGGLLRRPRASTPPPPAQPVAAPPGVTTTDILRAQRNR